MNREPDVRDQPGPPEISDVVPRLTAHDRRALQRRILEQEGWGEVRAGMDIGELPDRGDWDIWAVSVSSPDLAGLDHEDATAAVDAHLAELHRRQRLVDHARAIIQLAEAEQDLAQAAREMAELPERHHQAVEADRSRLRAYRAADSLAKLDRRAAERAAILTIRCPSGCVLARVYPRNPVVDVAGEDLLLVTTRRGDEETAWLVSSDAERKFAETLKLNCRHGSGGIPTTCADRIDRAARRTARTVDLPWVSWTTSRS